MRYVQEIQSTRLVQIQSYFTHERSVTSPERGTVHWIEYYTELLTQIVLWMWSAQATWLCRVFNRDSKHIMQNIKHFSFCPWILLHWACCNGFWDTLDSAINCKNVHINNIKPSQSVSESLKASNPQTQPLFSLSVCTESDMRVRVTDGPCGFIFRKHSCVELWSELQPWSLCSSSGELIKSLSDQEFL